MNDSDVENLVKAFQAKGGQITKLPSMPVTGQILKNLGPLTSKRTLKGDIFKIKIDGFGDVNVLFSCPLKPGQMVRGRYISFSFVSYAPISGIRNATTECGEKPGYATELIPTFLGYSQDKKSCLTR